MTLELRDFQPGDLVKHKIILDLMTLELTDFQTIVDLANKHNKDFPINPPMTTDSMIEGKKMIDLLIEDQIVVVSRKQKNTMLQLRQNVVIVTEISREKLFKLSENYFM